MVETLNRSQNVVKEVTKTSTAVTCDLVIVSVTMHIQNQQSRKYDPLFIYLEAFHIELAFFKTLGKTGGPYVLQEAKALAKGSIRSFLKGTNYKRCKSFHEILAVSFRFLLYEQYLYTIDNINKDATTTYQKIKNFKIAEKFF